MFRTVTPSCRDDQTISERASDFLPPNRGRAVLGTNVKHSVDSLAGFGRIWPDLAAFVLIWPLLSAPSILWPDFQWFGPEPVLPKGCFMRRACDVHAMRMRRASLVQAWFMRRSCDVHATFMRRVCDTHAMGMRWVCDVMRQFRWK